MLISIVAAVIVLGLLVLFHELGHYFVATRVGVGVTKFSIGFGPVIFGRRVGRTEYAISAIPLGGFVKMVGEDPEEELTEADRAIAFQTQPLWKRAAIVMAGPLSNLVFAFIAFSLVGVIYGTRVPSELAKVGAVIPKMPAAAAGLEAGDVILAVGATPVEKWDKLSETIRASGGKPVELTIQRGDTRVQVTLTPEARPDKNIFGETLGTAYVIGIERGFDQEDVGIGTAIVTGAEQTVWWVQTLLMSIVKLVQGRIPTGEIGGPILIAQAAGEQARMGFEYLLHFMAVISINLGVLNLLPIPVLDGGHLMFLTLEAVMRRPLDIRHREIAQQVGLVVLLSLMVFAFYNDIARVIRGWG